MFQEERVRQGTENLSQRIGQSIVFYRHKGNDTKEHTRMYTFLKG